MSRDDEVEAAVDAVIASYEAGGSHEAARELLQAALQRHPEAPDLWLQLALTHADSDASRAEQLIHHAVASDPHGPHTHANAANTALNADQPDLAERLLDAAGSHLDPDEPAVIGLRGRIHRLRDELPEAERLLSAARRAQPSFVPHTVELASVWIAQGRQDEARRIVREALTSAPDDIELQDLDAQLMPVERQRWRPGDGRPRGKLKL